MGVVIRSALEKSRQEGIRSMGDRQDFASLFKMFREDPSDGLMFVLDLKER